LIEKGVGIVVFQARSMVKNLSFLFTEMSDGENILLDKKLFFVRE
jgi:hypothetical protein